MRPHYPTAGPRPAPVSVGDDVAHPPDAAVVRLFRPAMEEALHDMPLLREFVRLDAGGRHAGRNHDPQIPAPERHQLAQTLFDETAALLAEKGLFLRQGTIVDATLIAAPPFTKNRDCKRDIEISSTQKGNDYYFGMKARTSGGDAESGLVHTVVVTTAKVADGVMTEALLHGDEQVVQGIGRIPARIATWPRNAWKASPVWAFPFKRRKGEDLSAEQTLHNRMLAPLRVAVEHPFWIVKRQFGYTQVRSAGCSRMRSSSICCLPWATFITLGRR